MTGPAAPTADAGCVLLLDADQPASLAVLRSLARQGLRVDVASSDTTAIGRLSRHVHARWTHPDPLADVEAFLQWLQGHLRQHVYELVIPLTERTVVPLAQQRDRFPPGLIAVADFAALAQVIDKQRTVALAASLGIPVPKAEPVATVEQALHAAQRIGYPVVVKPARSVGVKDGKRVQLSVSYAFDKRELVDQTESAMRYGSVMLQEYFSGDGVGIELIASHGTVQYAFQHRRLHEVPLTGGGSSLRISETPDPELLKAAAKLMQALQWHGVAMVEFKRDPSTGAFRLMEINGRFWGSLPLAVAAGADFPAMLHALMTTGAVGHWPPARPGVVARQLARDADWIEHVLRRNAPASLVQLPTAGQVLRDSLLVFSPRHHFDVQDWRDPWPGIVDLGRLLAAQYQRAARNWRHRRRLSLELRRARQRGLPLADSAGRILFLCYGNINRSALAEVAARQHVGTRKHVASAGFHDVQNRPADVTMVDVARGAGLDLSDWHSRCVSADLVDAADLILVMEWEHLARLRAAFPDAADKAFLLGALEDDVSSAEVADPYGKARDAYVRACRQVTQAVQRWLGNDRSFG